MEGVSWHEGRLRPRGMSKTVGERSELSLTLTNRSDSSTTKLAGPRRVEEGCNSPTAPCQLQVRNCMSTSSGQRRMSPLCSSPAKNLQLSQGKPKSRNAHRARLKRSPAWYLGPWNIRSLVDCEGPVETARQRTANESDNKRIDLVIRELKRCQVVVAGLQETKWFGNAMYKVGESIVMTAGRPMPTLQQGRTTSDHLHILSCYAPTFGANRSEKDHFLNDLQQAIDSIPTRESYVILEDFIARVGSRSGDKDLWGNVRGLFGLGEENVAGRKFLNFLLLNEATSATPCLQRSAYICKRGNTPSPKDGTA